MTPLQIAYYSHYKAHCRIIFWSQLLKNQINIKNVAVPILWLYTTIQYTRLAKTVNDPRRVTTLDYATTLTSKTLETLRNATNDTVEVKDVYVPNDALNYRRTTYTVIEYLFIHSYSLMATMQSNAVH